MRQRFTFSIRDWFWLCIVLALAIGWGGHFRYSSYLEKEVLFNRELHDVENLRRSLRAMAQNVSFMQKEIAATNHALLMVATTQQLEEVYKEKVAYRNSHP